MSPQTVTLAVLIVATGTATAIDLAQRRIPNALSIATAAIGVTLATTGATGISIGSSVLGCALGFILMLPGHLLGGTGAGDVKLFAATGTVLGAAQTFEAFLFVAIAGGVLAVGLAWKRGRLAHTVLQTARLCGPDAAAREAIESPAANNRFAYGPAIAVGCVLAAMW